jgi:hypothetical protein
VDDIINHYIAARGGLDKLNLIKSIYMKGVRRIMGYEVTLEIRKVQGKLFRTDFEYGGNRGFTIITPEKGWNYNAGNTYEAELISPDRLKSMQIDLDIPGILINYRSKGYHAFTEGKQTVNERECYRIHLISDDGNKMICFIDIKSFLLIQSWYIEENSGENAGSPGKEIINNYGNYKDFGGVLFPQLIITESPGVSAGTTVFNKIELNIEMDERWNQPDYYI